MDDRYFCQECGQQTHKIGPFASTKPEGAPARKFDGTYQNECTNAKCSRLGQIIDVTADELYMQSLDRVCTFGHVRRMHGYGISRIPEDGEIQPIRRDVECSATDCSCEAYEEAT